MTAEQLFELAYGRPKYADGWGMLQAKQTKTLTGPGGERIAIKAGASRVRYSHWAVRLHPEVFTVVDSRDVRSKQAHARALERVRQGLERATPAARSTPRPRAGVLSASAGSSPLRLPRPDRTPALRLP